MSKSSSKRKYKEFNKDDEDIFNTQISKKMNIQIEDNESSASNSKDISVVCIFNMLNSKFAYFYFFI